MLHRNMNSQDRNIKKKIRDNKMFRGFGSMYFLTSSGHVRDCEDITWRCTCVVCMIGEFKTSDDII